MSSLANFTTEKLKNVARLRNIDNYENMPRQQLENILTTSSASIWTPTPVSRPGPRPQVISANRISPVSRPITRHTTEHVPTDMDECEKTETVKTRPITENTCYQWYDYMVSQKYSKIYENVWKR